MQIFRKILLLGGIQEDIRTSSGSAYTGESNYVDFDYTRLNNENNVPIKYVSIAK